MSVEDHPQTVEEDTEDGRHATHGPARKLERADPNADLDEWLEDSDE